MFYYNYSFFNIIAFFNYSNSLLLDLLFKYLQKEEVKAKVLYFLPSIIALAKGIIKGIKKLAKNIRIVNAQV